MKKKIKQARAKKSNPIYRLLFSIVKLVYKKRKFINLKSECEPCVFVGNHCLAHSPMDFEITFPHKKKIWCISEVMSFSTAPNYMYNEFWKNKKKSVRPFYKLLSYILTPLAVTIFRGADTIAVYKDNRVSKTFKESITALKEGNSIVIFPECHKPYNNIICEFEQNFVYLAKLYYKKTGKQLCFVPFYNSPKLKTIIFGEPIKYNASLDINHQKEEICSQLKNSITLLAHSLPEHTVIPYENISRKNFPKSTY